MVSRCFDCRFFCSLDGVRADDLPGANDDGGCMQGECRRDTPVVGRFCGEDEAFEYDYGQWPLVLICDWCGRFEPCDRARHSADTSRHVCARSNISGVVQQGYDPAPGANVGVQPTQLHKTNGSFLAVVTVTAAGTVAVLDTVCFACPVFRKPIMETHYAG
jgi:hypothetical protein